MRKNYLMKLFFLLLALPLSVMAQSQKFKGKVTDVQGDPLSDVLITLEGTETTALTDRHGNFEMEAASGQIPITSLEIGRSPALVQNPGW
ncbi:hypothetical protein [Pedobacter nanyangensis]|uniref:hypothetical protein n=1 Tax=Pedobacter nanyangensis TaxID=1562389 RepID=UPI000DE1CD7C|nr:hypothetical protein [Pedobacter nanyangensis]